MTLTDVHWLSAVMAAARAAGVRELELVTPGGRARFTLSHDVSDRPSGAPAGQPVPSGYEQHMQLAEWLDEGRLCVVRSPTVGVWQPAVQRGEAIAKGAPLGQIRSAGIMVSVRSPIDGRMAEMYVESDQPVQYGQLLASLINA